MSPAAAQASVPAQNTASATRYAARGPTRASRLVDKGAPTIEAAMNKVVFQA